MIIESGGDMATSMPGEEPIYVVCTGKGGYGFSLTRFSDEPLIELMVEDQTNLPTLDLAAELHRDKLVVNVNPDAAKEIGIPAEYVVPLSTSDEQMARIDSTLAAIFSGVGRYQRWF